MSMFTWDDTLSVNIEEIDAQHQKLVELINELHDAMLQGHANQVIGVVIAELTKYTQSHFSSEERLMKAHGYPGLRQHKKEHDQLLAQVNELNYRSQAGYTVVSLVVLNFLKNWLVNHIQGTDMQYKPFLNDKGIT